MTKGEGISSKLRAAGRSMAGLSVVAAVCCAAFVGSASAQESETGEGFRIRAPGFDVAVAMFHLADSEEVLRVAGRGMMEVPGNDDVFLAEFTWDGSSDTVHVRYARAARPTGAGATWAIVEDQHGVMPFRDYSLFRRVIVADLVYDIQIAAGGGPGEIRPICGDWGGLIHYSTRSAGDMVLERAVGCSISNRGPFIGRALRRQAREVTGAAIPTR